MQPLSQPDYELLFDCVRELHSFRDPLSLRSWLLDKALPKLLPSDWLSYNEVDLVNPENTLAVLKPESSTVFQGLFPRFKEVAHQHPLIIGQMQSANFSVHKISDFISQEDYHRLDLYQDVYRHMGVEYQISATIKLQPDNVTAFALSRKKNDYSERDRTILQMLRPHLVVAFNNLALIGEQKAIIETSELALNELASATIIVDLQGHILYHTGSALQWIKATNPELLPAAISDWLNKGASNGSRRTLNLTSDAGEIHIRTVPTSSKQRLLLVLTRADDRPQATPEPADFGLSNRQLEVCNWICNGKTNAEIAGILGISPRTVQKHIENIFEKLGVESRMALTVFLNEKTNGNRTK